MLAIGIILSVFFKLAIYLLRAQRGVVGDSSISSLGRSREAAMHAEGGRDRRTPRSAAEGVDGGHRVAWRLLSRGSRAQALGVVCQVRQLCCQPDKTTEVPHNVIISVNRRKM